MRIGYIQVYNEIDWIGYIIDQAMMLCDKLLVMEGSQFVAFSDIPERSDDGTLDIISDKSKQYSDQIVLFNTTRKHKNYRRNQCDNFNRGLDLCDIGDYFLKLDADEFYFERFVEKINNLMDEGRVDCLKTDTLAFACGFKWAFNVHERFVFLKKIPNLHFVPSCRPVGYGPNTIKAKGVNRHHYTFVKPRERMRIRMMTSKFEKNMPEWFDANWDTIKLGDGEPFNYVSTKYTFKRYDGKHPSILDDHPWRYVEDIRRLEI